VPGEAVRRNCDPAAAEFRNKPQAGMPPKRRLPETSEWPRRCWHMVRIALALGLFALAGCMTGPIPIGHGAATSNPSGPTPSSEVNPITGDRGHGGGM